MSSPKIQGPGDYYVESNTYYKDRVAQECVECRQDIYRLILLRAGSAVLAEEVLDKTISRVTEYAIRHGLGKEIKNVKAFCVTTAYRVLLDAQSKKLKADKLETVSLDDELYVETAGLAVNSPAKGYEEHIDIERAKFSLLDEGQRRMFEMRHEEGLEVREVAEMFSVSETTMRHRLAEIRAILRQALRDYV